jgi:branched-chain amino acid transport system ATP-binding protein
MAYLSPRKAKSRKHKHGEQKMQAIGRGLMAEPRLLLRDDPSLELAPVMMDELVSLIEAINRGGVSILLVEQNVFLALQAAHGGYVTEAGRAILEGNMQQFRNRNEVKRAYLGV